MGEATEGPGIMTEHLTVHTTDRGFKHMPEVATSHGGIVRVYESSAARAPHVWLAVKDGMGGEAHGHLSVEAAQQVAEQLLQTIAAHYQTQE